MRILFTFVGGSGHFIPTEPLAQALVGLGHEVRYACQEGMLPTVRSRGWDAIATGGATLLAHDQRRPLIPLDREAEQQAIRRSFADMLARQRAPALLTAMRDWRPHLVVRDEVDFAAAVVAESCGLPHAAVVVIAAGGFLTRATVAEPLAALRAEHGLSGDAMLMLHRYLTLVPVPPSFRDPLDPLPETAHHMRPAALAQADTDPDSPTIRGARPTLYFTLGTIFHQESGDLFGRVLAGLRSLSVDVVVTVGREIDPAELGSQPPHVRIHRYLPAAEVLPHCALVVSHGGSGTVIGSLAFGLPQLLLPLGADQPLNADRCQALGVASVLDAMSATSVAVSTAARQLLEDPAYRQHAHSLRDEIHSLPGALDAARLLEQLAHSHAPITTADG